jgi:hypothetical protein
MGNSSRKEDISSRAKDGPIATAYKGVLPIENVECLIFYMMKMVRCGASWG